jgi:Questin oxidase-like
VQLVQEARANDMIRTAAHWSDNNKIRDGIFKRAGPEITSLAAQWRVQADKLEQKTAEMINADVYFAGGAQKAGKEVKFDFLYMHCVNCSVFFSALLKEGWMKVEDKVRLLEWKGRLDLLIYASRGCPELRTDDITNYTPKEHCMGWTEIIRNVDRMKDNGHVAKFIRALKNGEAKCKPYELEGDDAFPIKGEMWLKLAQMGLESTNVGVGEVKWAGNVGFSQAWEKIPDRARL